MLSNLKRFRRELFGSIPNPVINRSQLASLSASKGKRCLISCAAYTGTLSAEGILALIDENFDGWTPERELKMSATYPGTTAPSSANISAFLANYNKIGPGKRVRGHTLIWHESLPVWAENLAGLTKAEVEAIVKRYITQVVEAVGNRVDCWDVLNEIIAFAGGGLRETVWSKAFGNSLVISKTNPYVIFLANCFKWAHEANPTATLFINEANAELESTYTGTGRGAELLKLVKVLRELGAPVDGVGLEFHTNTKRIPTTAELKKIISTWTAEGLAVEITELSCIIEPGDTASTQAQCFSNVMSAALQSGASRVTVWGTTDRYSFENVAWEAEHGKAATETEGPKPMPFDWNGKPKAAWGALARSRVARFDLPITVVNNTALIDMNTRYGVKPGDDVSIPVAEALAEGVAAGAGVIEIYFSEPGHYKVERAQQTGEAFGYHYSGQILLPARTVTAGALTIVFKGCAIPPKMLLGTPPGEKVATVAGVVLVSNASTGNMVDVIPGFEASATPWSNLCVIQENLVTQMPPNPQGTAWELQCAKTTKGRGTVRIEAPGSAETLNNNETLTGSGFAINMPAIGNAGGMTFESLLIHGFPVAVGLTEHVKINYLFAGTCNWMLEGRGSGHANEIFASCEENVGMIRSSGAGKRGTLLYMLVSMENVNTSGAFAPGVFIEDTQGELHGEIVLKLTAATYGSLPVIGANNLNVRMLAASTPENFQGRLGWHQTYLEDNLKRAVSSSAGLGAAYPSMHPQQMSKAWSDAGGQMRMTASEEGKVTFRQPVTGTGSRWYRCAITPAAGAAANFGLIFNEKAAKSIQVRFRENKLQILGTAGTVVAETPFVGGSATELFVVVHNGTAKALATYNAPVEVVAYIGEEEKVKWVLTKAEREELSVPLGQTFVTDGVKANKDTTSFYSSLYSGALTAA